MLFVAIKIMHKTFQLINFLIASCAANKTGLFDFVESGEQGQAFVFVLVANVTSGEMNQSPDTMSFSGEASM